jgi:hypothetical protein
MESSLMPADRDRQDKGKNKFKKLVVLSSLLSTDFLNLFLPLFFLMESSLMPADRDRQDKGKNKFKN